MCVFPKRFLGFSPRDVGETKNKPGTREQASNGIIMRTDQSVSEGRCISFNSICRLKMFTMIINIKKNIYLPHQLRKYTLIDIVPSPSKII